MPVFGDHAHGGDQLAIRPWPTRPPNQLIHFFQGSAIAVAGFGVPMPRWASAPWHDFVHTSTDQSPALFLDEQACVVPVHWPVSMMKWTITARPVALIRLHLDRAADR